MNPAPTEAIVIPLSKNKLALLVLGSSAFVAGSIWMWSNAEAQPRFNPVWLKCVSLVGMLFFGICGIYGCIKFFDDKPGLIVDDEGIVDNSSAVAAGRICWDEIIGISVSEMAGQRFLTIEVVDPQKYIERCGYVVRILHMANIKAVGSPINISANSLKMSFKELVSLMSESLDLHKAVE